MKSYQIDFHGLTVKQSRQMFLLLLEKNVQVGKVLLITGYGEIQKELIRVLNDYSITWHFDGPNRGCLVAYLTEREE